MAETTATLPDWPVSCDADRNGTRVAVLVEGGRRGHAAVRHALALAAQEPIDAILVAVIAHVENSGCTMSAGPLNDAVRESATADLDRAAAQLTAVARTTGQMLLRDRVDLPLSSWAAANRIELILLPGRARRLRHGLHHPHQRALADGDAAVRIV